MPPTFAPDTSTLEAGQMEAESFPTSASISARDPATLLLCLPAMSPDALAVALSAIAAAFPGEQLLVASPHQNALAEPAADPFPSIRILPYPAERANLGWVLAAADYASSARLAADQDGLPCILIGGLPTSADAPLLRALAKSVRSNVDLVVPRFDLGPSDGLVNAALLYPLSRALFGADIRFPLPVNAALSPRMAQRLASTTQRLVNVNQGGSLVWPVAEAAIAGFSVREVDAVGSFPPPPPQEDFTTLFSNVTGSLFSDIETRATFWQRARALPTRPVAETLVPASEADTIDADIQSIVVNFQLAQANLQEIWSLVLPPQSRLAFKKLSLLPANAFTMDPNLWARTVYDFALAFHLRTLNRNHLLGAMTPLYLAWVASYLRSVANDPSRAATAIEQTASAFETEKSYFVSRWRWPDRFNP
jgi:hypothetical protein